MNRQGDHPPEKTNMQNYVDGMWRLAYAVVLLLISLLGFGMIGELGSSDSYGSLVALLYVAIYVLLAPALVLLIMGKKVPRTLRWVPNGLVGLLCVVVAFLAVGNIQDAVGITCAGFMAVASPCADSQLLVAIMLLLSPYVFLPVIILSLLGLVKGWRDYLKARQTR